MPAESSQAALRRPSRAAAVALSVALAVASVPSAAYATKVGELRDEVAQTKAEIEEMHARAEETSEEVARLEAEMTALDGRRQEAQKRLDAARADLARSTRAGYKSGSAMSVIDVILASETIDELVTNVKYAASVRDDMAQRADAVRAERAELDGIISQRRADAQAAQTERERLDSQVAELEGKVGSLSGELRDAINSSLSGRAFDAGAVYEAAMVDIGGDETRRALIDAAFSQIGVPYGYGSYAPGSSLDCSGFVAYAYSRIGVGLPHSSVAQSGIATHKAYEDLLPGDLLFWVGTSSNSGSGSHVAMYLGNGQMIHASWEGVIVQGVYGGWNACGSVL